MFMNTINEDDSEDSFKLCLEINSITSALKQGSSATNISTVDEQKKLQELFDYTHSEGFFNYNSDWIMDEDEEEERYLDLDPLEQQ